MPTSKSFIIVTASFEEVDDDTWTAKCVELGTATFGHSLSNAKDLLKEAIELHLETLGELGELEAFLKENGIALHTDQPVEEPVAPLPLSDIFLTALRFRLGNDPRVAAAI